MRCIFSIREWSEKTIRIESDEEEDKRDGYSVSVNGLKKRYEYRETKRKMRCLLCIREWSEKTIRIQRDEKEDEMSTLYQ